jgi:hypothetical protein
MDDPGQTGRRSENGKAGARLAAAAASDLAHSRNGAWRKILALLRPVHPTCWLMHLAGLLAAASASRRTRELSMAPITRLKRRLLAVAVLTFMAFGAVWLLWPEPAIGPASYQRIELGMTQPEIEAIIGLPPGDYTGRPKATALNLPVRRNIPIRIEEKGIITLQDGAYSVDDRVPGVEWLGSRCFIVVVFEDGQATYCGLHVDTMAGKPPGLLDQIRSWLGW